MKTKNGTFPQTMSKNPQSLSTYRILDANLNRTREAFRVIEEHYRFISNSQTGASKLKIMRSRLTELIALLDQDKLLRARNTSGDVGTTLNSPMEHTRSSKTDLLRANFKRAQEALRSLEEYAKLCELPALPLGFKSLRYQSYELEKELNSSAPKLLLQQASVMLIVSEKSCRKPLQEVLYEAYAAGIRCFQLREKNGSDRKRLDSLEKSASWLLAQEACVVIVNDRPDFALALEAHGVHLGQDDMASVQAREILGSESIIGLSTHNPKEIQKAEEADYYGAGAMFASSTKEVQVQSGLDWGEQAHELSDKPTFCIGGIQLENAPELQKRKIQRIAVCSAICGSEDPGLSARSLLELFPPLELEKSGL